MHRPTHALFLDGKVYARIEIRGQTVTVQLLPTGAVAQSRSPSLRDAVLGYGGGLGTRKREREFGGWRGPFKYLFSEGQLDGIPWGAKVVPWSYVTEFVPEEAKRRPAVG